MYSPLLIPIGNPPLSLIENEAQCLHGTTGHSVRIQAYYSVNRTVHTIIWKLSLLLDLHTAALVVPMRSG